MNTCPMGTIKRKGAGCIKNRGKPGKGPKLFTLKTGLLGVWGYHNVVHKSAPERRLALIHSVTNGGEPSLGLYRRLNALYILTRLTNPRASLVFRRDRDWVGKMFGYGRK